MFLLGILGMGCGIVLMLLGIFLDTSTEVGHLGLGLPERVNNLGLLVRNVTLVYSGAGILVAGSLFTVGSLLARKIEGSVAALKSAIHPTFAPVNPLHGASPPLAQKVETPVQPTAKKTVHLNDSGSPEAWDAVEAKAISLGYTTRRDRHEFRISSSKGISRTFNNIKEACQYLGMPWITPLRNLEKTFPPTSTATDKQ